MTMTSDQLATFYNEAAQLEWAGDFEAARDAFQVAADAAEEMGAFEWPGEARRRALQNHVAAWAVRRWPAESISIHDVRFSQFPFGTFGRRRSRVDLSIRRRRYPNVWARVTVGRRGDIRLEHDGLTRPGESRGGP